MVYRMLVVMLFVQQVVTGQEKTLLQSPSDIYLLIGQSNMAGRGQVDSISKITNPAILMFDKLHQWVPATDPMHFDKKEAGVGPGLSFAQSMLEQNPSAIIGLIPCAVGGTNISKWQPGVYDSATKTHPYDDAVKRIRVALQSGTLKGILWHQGEGDSGGSRYKLYAQRFDSLLFNLKQDLGIRTDSLPVVVGELGYFYVKKAPNAKFINEILHQIAGAHGNIACVSSDGLTDKGDTTHFDTQSARELGKRYAQAMKQLQREAEAGAARLR